MIIFAVYVLMSLVTFCAYGLDKFKARKGTWRVPEKTLHVLELCCGWPGALLAQHLLRHKSYKKSFRVIFWMMVVSNVGLMFAAENLLLK